MYVYILGCIYICCIVAKRLYLYLFYFLWLCVILILILIQWLTVLFLMALVLYYFILFRLRILHPIFAFIILRQISQRQINRINEAHDNTSVLLLVCLSSGSLASGPSSYEVASPASQELYVFDGNGTHQFTMSLVTGDYKYNFSYRLVLVKINT